MSQAMQSDRTAVAAVSLVLGPLLMSVGDLIHPHESWDPAIQASMIMEHASHASRWYVAHLLLFVGILVIIPGILAIASLTAERAPRGGYASVILSLIGVASFAAIFVGEMLIGRYVSDGANVSAATKLLETFQSGPILGAVMVGGIAFFLGVAALAVPLICAGGTLRWPALAFVAERFSLEARSSPRRSYSARSATSLFSRAVSYSRGKSCRSVDIVVFSACCSAPGRFMALCGASASLAA